MVISTEPHGWHYIVKYCESPTVVFTVAVVSGNVFFVVVLCVCVCVCERETSSDWA